VNWRNPVHLLAAFVLAVLAVSLAVFLARLASGSEYGVPTAPAPSWSFPSCYSQPSGSQPWGSAYAGC